MSVKNRFVFQRKGVNMQQRKALTRFATTHARDCTTYATQAHTALNVCLRFLRSLEETENVLLEEALLEPTALEAAQKDRDLIRNVLAAVAKLEGTLGEIRADRLRRAAEMEVELENAYKEARKEALKGAEAIVPEMAVIAAAEAPPESGEAAPAMEPSDSTGGDSKLKPKFAYTGGKGKEKFRNTAKPQPKPTEGLPAPE